MLEAKLNKGGEDEYRVRLLISLTRISSEAMIEALILHLVRGYTFDLACYVAGTDKGSLKRAVDKLERVNTKVEQIKNFDLHGIQE